MIKQLRLALLSCAALACLSGNLNASEPFYRMWMTDAENVVPTENVEVFNGTTPWVYIRYMGDRNSDDVIGPGTIKTFWTWDGTPVDITYNITTSGNKNDFWIPFNETSFGTMAAGNWTVTATSTLFTSGKVKTYFDSKTFKLNPVPEPISSFLFLTGGLTMAFGLKRGKRKK
ncbi:MAG TPA: PEP-CTERM sorting domain-containing protein [Candidatus Omnitrophota bacterium]|nr:PEP-CTERM sorting domain-containing protein [Candidatus Omnitrophota bacterium]